MTSTVVFFFRATSRFADAKLLFGQNTGNGQQLNTFKNYSCMSEGSTLVASQQNLSLMDQFRPWMHDYLIGLLSQVAQRCDGQENSDPAARQVALQAIYQPGLAQYNCTPTHIIITPRDASPPVQLIQILPYDSRSELCTYLADSKHRIQATVSTEELRSLGQDDSSLKQLLGYVLILKTYDIIVDRSTTRHNRFSLKVHKMQWLGVHGQSPKGLLPHALERSQDLVKTWGKLTQSLNDAEKAYIEKTTMKYSYIKDASQLDPTLSSDGKSSLSTVKKSNFTLSTQLTSPEHRVSLLTTPGKNREPSQILFQTGVTAVPRFSNATKPNSNTALLNLHFGRLTKPMPGSTLGPSDSLALHEHTTKSKPDRQVNSEHVITNNQIDNHAVKVVHGTETIPGRNTAITDETVKQKDLTMQDCASTQHAQNEDTKEPSDISLGGLGVERAGQRAREEQSGSLITKFVRSRKRSHRLSACAVALPTTQRNILTKDESWFPSLTGTWTPVATAPIAILSELNSRANAGTIIPQDAKILITKLPSHRSPGRPELGQQRSKTPNQVASLVKKQTSGSRLSVTASPSSDDSDHDEIEWLSSQVNTPQKLVNGLPANSSPLRPGTSQHIISPEQSGAGLALSPSTHSRSDRALRIVNDSLRLSPNMSQVVVRHTDSEHETIKSTASSSGIIPVTPDIQTVIRSTYETLPTPENSGSEHDLATSASPSRRMEERGQSSQQMLENAKAIILSTNKTVQRPINDRLVVQNTAAHQRYRANQDYEKMPVYDTPKSRVPSPAAPLSRSRPAHTSPPVVIRTTRSELSPATESRPSKKQRLISDGLQSFLKDSASSLTPRDMADNIRRQSLISIMTADTHKERAAEISPRDITFVANAGREMAADQLNGSHSRVEQQTTGEEVAACSMPSTETGSVASKVLTDHPIVGEATCEPLGRDYQIDLYKRFKCAYPEYDGDETHFVKLLKKIAGIVGVRSLFPPSLWDDFIVRQRVEFPNYIQTCLASGEDPVKYEEYYATNGDCSIRSKKILTRRVLAELTSSWNAHTRPESPISRAGSGGQKIDPLSSVLNTAHSTPPLPRQNSTVKKTLDKEKPIHSDSNLNTEPPRFKGATPGVNTQKIAGAMMTGSVLSNALTTLLCKSRALATAPPESTQSDWWKDANTPFRVFIRDYNSIVPARGNSYASEADIKRGQELHTQRLAKVRMQSKD